MPYSAAYIAWFNAQVEKSPGCWPWTGPVSVWGYGRASIGNQKRKPAHRVALEIALGRPVPYSKFACHECNNQLCCRVGPGHVYEGTPKQNSEDRERAGTGTMQLGKGANNPSAKITEDDVRYIRKARADGVPIKTLCEKFGLSSGQISMIAQKKKWTHVE